MTGVARTGNGRRLPLPWREYGYGRSTRQFEYQLVEALTRAEKVEEARLIFEQMLSYANHPGLYAEEIGPSGGAPGNFPQAFTHLALISAAFDLDRVLGAGT